ncbi:MAG TPA: glycerol-3-phosphate acyltransferase, partial [Alphaproteobacteria bacterium]|nr:glycerol-3-phosphate acyltransferase [Alphaproteobacteria bacterium]
IFASFCLMGHVFPVWLKFKGGKGVAIALGAIMALDPMLALISLVIWLLAVKVTKISALGALTAFASAPLTAYFLSSLPCFTFTIVLCPFIFWTHRENILRLIKSDEHNF